MDLYVVDEVADMSPALWDKVAELCAKYETSSNVRWWRMNAAGDMVDVTDKIREAARQREAERK